MTKYLLILLCLWGNASLAVNDNMIDSSIEILIWDNNGTISEALNPDDKSSKQAMILPGVRDKMKEAKYNFVASGYKSPESESQNFDPDQIILQMHKLMDELPINAIAFSPAIGGTECYVLIRKGRNIITRKAHQKARYQQHIGKFKKPDAGMLFVIKDVAKEEFGVDITSHNTIMIGDTWHDKSAAEAFGIGFVEAKVIHER